MQSTLRLLLLLTILYFVQNEPTTSNLTGRIVNGTEAVLGQFPHQVSLMRTLSRRHFCGGNVISASLVLTAGHCMYSSNETIQPWSIIVAGGIVKLNENSTRQERGVKEIRLHPEFDLTTLVNDIAALKLSRPFTFTPELRSAPLSGNPPIPYTICQVSGWGYLSSSVPIIFPDLMYVDLPIRSTEECRKLLKNHTDMLPGMFCAGYLKGGKDSCQGDSGGGMVCNGVLTGLISGGVGCALPMLPGLYADVFYYLDWILNDTETVVVVQGRDFSGNYGTSNMPSIIIAIISYFFCAVINPTDLVDLLLTR
jgi:secreted trypsin-like serine protease